MGVSKRVTIATAHRRGATHAAERDPDRSRNRSSCALWRTLFDSSKGRIWYILLGKTADPRGGCSMPRRRLSEIFFGPRLDPFSQETKRHVVLVAFLAWIGLGADGLSSSCYGPEEAFLALGAQRHLGLYLALATAATVFIIAVAYNQVIELFPSGGGGYKVATNLIGPSAGLVSGAALIVDYMLTIAISIASGVDAIFSSLPRDAQAYKLVTEIVMVAVLLGLNL